MVRDVYPAMVAVPLGAVDPRTDPISTIAHHDDTHLRLRACRTVITRERLYVWATPMGFPSIVYERLWTAWDPLPEHARPGEPLTLSVSAYDLEWQIAIVSDEAAGCGCGSPLKSLQPFTPYRLGPL